MTYPDPPPPGLMAGRSCDALQSPAGSVSHVKSGQADMPITMTALPDSPYTHVQGEFVFTAEEGVIVSGSFDACHVGAGTCVR